MTKLIEKPSLPNGALSRLRAQESGLSPSLQRVAQHVLTHPEQVVYHTITELADAAQVGEASVTRLCHKLGFPGFHAFKLALTADLASQSNQDEGGGGHALSDLAALAARQAIGALEDTRNILDPHAFERVVNALLTAPRIDVTGQGSSHLAAQFLVSKLMRVGLIGLTHADPHVAAVSAATLPQGGVLLGFTRSGSTLDTIQNMRLARGAGAFTVAVTNRASSPITAFADEVLYTASPEGPLAGGAISSLASQILVTEVLYLALAERALGAQDFIRRTAESVVEKKI